MDIVQSFYDSLADQYDKLFQDWDATTREQAVILDRLFRQQGFDTTATVLDCACGIGTQVIGLADLGYPVTGSDISEAELAQAKVRAAGREITFQKADFRELSHAFGQPFDIVIAMDNALPHMLSEEDLEQAVRSITGQLKDTGIFVGSIRDYDALLKEKPPYSPPYIHKTETGQRVSFQTWEWEEDRYKLVQYMIEDGKTLEVSKFACMYRAVRRQALTELFLACGCSRVCWLFPEETGFYQPIIIARK